VNYHRKKILLFFYLAGKWVLKFWKNISSMENSPLPSNSFVTFKINKLKRRYLFLDMSQKGGKKKY